jgi:hypothetical protein
MLPGNVDVLFQAVHSSGDIPLIQNVVVHLPRDVRDLLIRFYGCHCSLTLPHLLMLPLVSIPSLAPSIRVPALSL